MLNGVVLMSSVNQLRTSTGLREAVLSGASRRLRPVLMATCVASFGFLPMAFATSTGAEVQRPLATVVIGGLVSATAVADVQLSGVAAAGRILRHVHSRAPRVLALAAVLDSDVGADR